MQFETSLLPLNNFYPVMPTKLKRKRKRRIIADDSVARYGPRTSYHRKGLKYNSFVYNFTTELGHLLPNTFLRWNSNFRDGV